MKRHSDIGTFSMCTDYNGNDVFNDSDEEERYQAFKARLIKELRPACRVHDAGSSDPHTEWFLTSVE